MNPEKLYAVIPFRRRTCGKEHPKGREYQPRFDLAPMTHSEACAWMRSCRTEVTDHRLIEWPANIPHPKP